jgi:3-oxoacyl-[acyl-carrier protein] reductase
MSAMATVPGAATIGSYPDLPGKVAVVTGGSRGIGAATARALAGNGVTVVVVGRDRAALEATVESITAGGGTATGVRADCTSDEDVAALRAEVVDRYGRADVLAAFAGGNGMPVPTVEETSAHWRQVVDNELTSTFLTVSAFLPLMLERGAGSVITMSSAAARQPARSSAAYAAAKAGVVAFSRHLAAEVADRGVRVNCLAPAAVENDRMRARMTDDDRRRLGATFPLRRIGRAEDVAAATLFLASAASSWITGITIDVAGGKVMP